VEKWTVVEGYAPSRWHGGRVAICVLGALLLGVAGGAVWQWNSASAPDTGPSSAIEWNAVQAVPKRAPDAADLEWEMRSVEQGSPTTSSGRALQEADWKPDRVRNSGAATPGIRASFGYCHTGGGTNCVVDGDTFWIGGEKVRIAGIDAPETHPPRCDTEARLGNAATEKLHQLLNSGPVTMTSIDRDRDRYGRLLRNVQVNGQDVGEAMIAAGVAREYGTGRKPWC
jgi:endonuclease YncB( thermonuclease family)